jgi:AmmeMemoRadiSam system protein A
VCDLTVIGPTLPSLARSAIDLWLRKGSRLNIETVPAPAAPVFVTLHSDDGQLRGCMGTLVAREPDVRWETVRCAILAATDDPRFASLPLDELVHVTIDVTVLCPMEPIGTSELLDPKRYGVVVSDAQGRRGVLLPDLEGIDDVETQLRIVRRKAGIPLGAKMDMKRFEALRFCENQIG